MGRRGLEPRTYRLKGECSTIELATHEEPSLAWLNHPGIQNTKVINILGQLINFRHCIKAIHEAPLRVYLTQVHVIGQNEEFLARGGYLF